MTAPTPLKTGSEVTLTVRVAQVRSFWRRNFHSRSNELVYCISMQDCDAGEDDPWYVTFTSGRFAESADEGKTLRSTGKVQRFQEYGGKPQIVLNYCKVL